MTEQPPNVDQKTGPSLGPDIRFEHSGSTVEVFNSQALISGPDARIYDRSDFGGVIERVTLDTKNLLYNQDREPCIELDLGIHLDPYRNQNSYSDPLGHAIKYFDSTGSEGKGTYWDDVRYIVTKSGMRLLAAYWPKQNSIRLYNNTEITGRQGSTPIAMNVNAPRLSGMDGNTQLEEFMRVAVDLVDKAQGTPLKRTYKIGETIKSAKKPALTPQALGKSAVKKPEVPPMDQPPPGVESGLEQFRDILTNVDKKVSLSDVGGLEAVKRELQDIALSFAKPEVMEKWGAERPPGVLLYGPPGTGKTMLVEALANEIGADLLQIQSPDIFKALLGASGDNIKALFSGFRQLEKPTVVLFDEFDAIVAITENPGPGGADNERNAVAGIFKQEMNTLARDNPNVLIVGTTNHQDRIDPALVRRFGHKIYVPMPDQHGRDQIISGTMSKLMVGRENGDFKIFADDVNVERLVDATDGLSGADITEIFRRLSLAKAMQEARTGSADPINQAGIEQIIQDFKVDSIV